MLYVIEDQILKLNSLKRRVRIVAKSAYYRRRVYPSACLASMDAGRAERMSLKLGIGDFHQNLTRKSRFG
jgi:hypothetical protein